MRKRKWSKKASQSQGDARWISQPSSCQKKHKAGLKLTKRLVTWSKLYDKVIGLGMRAQAPDRATKSPIDINVWTPALSKIWHAMLRAANKSTATSMVSLCIRTLIQTIKTTWNLQKYHNEANEIMKALIWILPDPKQVKITRWATYCQKKHMWRKTEHQNWEAP